MFLGHIHYLGAFWQTYNKASKLDIHFRLLVTKTYLRWLLEHLVNFWDMLGHFLGHKTHIQTNQFSYLANFQALLL